MEDREKIKQLENEIYKLKVKHKEEIITAILRTVSITMSIYTIIISLILIFKN